VATGDGKNQWFFARGRPTTSSSGASTAGFAACCRPLNWGVSGHRMPTSPEQWVEAVPRDGVVHIGLRSWKDFGFLVTSEAFPWSEYVFRGHKSARWLLLSTIDRACPEGRLKESDLAKRLDRFKYAVRGRRGGSPAKLDEMNDWWALGQHFGLHTPLLDWTSSPFVAAFFAVESPPPESSDAWAIWALNREEVSARSTEILKKVRGKVPPRKRVPEQEIVEFVEPLSDENARLVNQSGLFTRAPVGIDLESWVQSNFRGKRKSRVLLKITCPPSERELALEALDRMNINHATLFPDLHGASMRCNVKFARSVAK
jgi:hypothetical protein